MSSLRSSLRIGVSRPAGGLAGPMFHFKSALYPSKSGLAHIHIVKHIVTWTRRCHIFRETVQVPCPCKSGLTNSDLSNTQAYCEIYSIVKHYRLLHRYCPLKPRSYQWQRPNWGYYRDSDWDVQLLRVVYVSVWVSGLFVVEISLEKFVGLAGSMFHFRCPAHVSV